MKTTILLILIAAGAAILLASFREIYALRHAHPRFMVAMWLGMTACFGGAAGVWAWFAPEF